MPDRDKDTNEREGEKKKMKPPCSGRTCSGWNIKKRIRNVLDWLWMYISLFLTWVNIYRLMSFPLYGNKATKKKKTEQRNPSVIMPPAPFPFGFIMRFKPILETLLKCACASAEITPPAV